MTGVAIRGPWKFGEGGDLIIDWHRYAQIPSTQACQLMERDHDLVDNITFLLPVAQVTTHAPHNVIHHAHSAQRGCHYFKPMALREDGSVKFDEGSPHGSWRREDKGDLVINCHFNGDEDKTEDHRYHKDPNARAWCALP